MLQKYWIYLVTLFSAIALASALIAEFYFNLAPCDMCLKQREPYYIIILGFIFITILGWQERVWFYLGVQLISIYGLFYSIWHVGIENKLLSGPAECSDGLNITNNASSSTNVPRNSVTHGPRWAGFVFCNPLFVSMFLLFLLVCFHYICRYNHLPLLLVIEL